jgi:hypothetical protein
MIPWFACVGMPLAPSETDTLHALMQAEPLLAGAHILAVATWQEATSLAREMEADAVWWNHEEAERERLWHAASDRMGETELLRRLSSLATGDAGVQATVAAAAARADFTDAAAIRDAAGAVLLAAHQNALAAFAGEDDHHAFARKYALFAGGRWPLGYHQGRYVFF